jgi:hypothetical protein
LFAKNEEGFQRLSALDKFALTAALLLRPVVGVANCEKDCNGKEAPCEREGAK